MSCGIHARAQHQDLSFRLGVSVRWMQLDFVVRKMQMRTSRPYLLTQASAALQVYRKPWNLPRKRELEAVLKARGSQLGDQNLCRTY